MSADIILGTDFQARCNREPDELQAVSEAYLETQDESHLDKLVNCIKGLPRLHDVGGKPAFTFKGVTTVLDVTVQPTPL